MLFRSEPLPVKVRVLLPFTGLEIAPPKKLSEATEAAPVTVTVPVEICGVSLPPGTCPVDHPAGLVHSIVPAAGVTICPKALPTIFSKAAATSHAGMRKAQWDDIGAVGLIANCAQKAP